ncbi:VOC family protein [Pedobacter frigoris]|uniref:VOC family protein n=1 Tax=Pedobacter frigoris TaxID=2571272 RepID=UPI00292DF2FF|nr:VOC family protein [Pedobacter frigoris]
MKTSIYPCLTLKGKVAEAADFYIATFGDGKITQTSPFVISISLSGEKFMLLNDGPTSLPNPSISFMVISETAEETETYWHKMIEGGNSLMELGSYPWSPKYGWVQDKFGVSWQLYTGSKTDTPQKFCPTLMFTGKQLGKAAEAMHFYTDLYPNSAITGIMKYAEGEGDNTDYVKHGQFKIKDYITMAMDSSFDHGFGFNDAISFVVECEDQAEIDKYWDTLTSNGGREIQCGWLVDKYGLSWQIIPKALMELVKNPERAQRVMGALMKMKKLILADLENA